ncbi:hypothetical protein [Variovorax sp. PAMC26660]|uniref:hypothetical protein n=1 Tax=Variovorax sp. PAMC26660 TaxID=2762322 RepID=UPI00164DA631|nr:hypothetical protein [Variovorax sp. PAMC26660]QNK70563.1 hypothetical protein H7F35_13155 [Variovorax sp. PAMC26660]
MAAFNKAEFWRELNATDEDFIRKKHASGGYSPAKHREVTAWIKLRDEQKREDREVAQHRVVVSSANTQKYAAMIVAIVTVGGVAFGYLFK